MCDSLPSRNSERTETCNVVAIREIVEIEGIGGTGPLLFVGVCVSACECGDAAVEEAGEKEGAGGGTGVARGGVASGGGVPFEVAFISTVVHGTCNSFISSQKLVTSS